MPNTFHCVARDLPQAGCMGTGSRKSQTAASLHDELTDVSYHANAKDTSAS